MYSQAIKSHFFIDFIIIFIMFPIMRSSWCVIAFDTDDGEVGESVNYYINIYYILSANKDKTIIFIISFLATILNTVEDIAFCLLRLNRFVLLYRCPSTIDNSLKSQNRIFSSREKIALWINFHRAFLLPLSPRTTHHSHSIVPTGKTIIILIIKQS